MTKYWKITKNNVSTMCTSCFMCIMNYAHECSTFVFRFMACFLNSLRSTKKTGFIRHLYTFLSHLLSV